MVINMFLPCANVTYLVLIHFSAATLTTGVKKNKMKKKIKVANKEAFSPALD